MNLKNRSIQVIDNSTGQTGRIRSLYGNDAGFTSAKVVYDNNNLSRNVPIRHLTVKASKVFENTDPETVQLAKLQEINQQLYSALDTIYKLITHPANDADETIKELVAAKSALTAAREV